MGDIEKDPSSPGTPSSREEKTLYEEFQEMPYSLDRVGQSFVMFNPYGPRIFSGVKTEDPVEELTREQRIEKQRAIPEKKHAVALIT